MRLRRRLARRAHGVGEELERPPGVDLRVELAERAGGGVARVGEDARPLADALAGGGAARLFLHQRRLPRVEGEELGLLHEDLAADLDARGRLAPSLQLLG